MKVIDEVKRRLSRHPTVLADWEAFLAKCPTSSSSAENYIAEHPEEWHVPFADIFKTVRGRIQERREVERILVPIEPVAPFAHLRVPAVVNTDSVARHDRRTADPPRVEVTSGRDATIRRR